MILLAPAMAWLLPLALAPVVFHLFFRIRRQPRPFPSLLFFLAGDPHLHARRRFREWLALVLRTLALTLLLLALARPVKPGWGGGEARAILIIDNSASMAAADREGRSRLNRAVAAGAALLQDPDVRQAALLTSVNDLAVPLPDGFSEDLGAVRAALAGVRTTHADGAPAIALAQAGRLARTIVRGVPEIHIFTDLQAAEWNAAPPTPATFPPGSIVLLHDVSSPADRAGTVALLPPENPRQPPACGRPWRAEASVRNLGADTAEVAVNAAVGEARARDTLRLAPNQTVLARLPMPALPAGDHPLRVWLDGAAAGPASEHWQVVRVAAAPEVRLAGGTELYGRLPVALAPTGDERSGVRLTVVPARELASTGASAPALLVVTFDQVADAAVAEMCRAHAVAGGTLLICPSALASGHAPVVLPGWCGVGAGAEGASEAGIALVSLKDDAPLWRELHDAQGAVALHDVRVHRWIPLHWAADNATAVAGLADGTPLLTRQLLGRGQVYVGGFAWDERWSDLPRRAGFLALAHAFVERAQNAPAPSRIALAAAPLPVSRTAAFGRLEIRTVAGDPLAWCGQWGACTAPARAGVYRVTGASEPLTLAIAGSPAESAPARADPGAVPVLAGLDYRRIAGVHAVADAAAVRQARQGRGLAGWLLLLAGLVWLAELWVVHARSPLTVVLRSGMLHVLRRGGEATDGGAA